jgi:1-deoxy-D-xylulose-5-phosphate synthase
MDPTPQSEPIDKPATIAEPTFQPVQVPQSLLQPPPPAEKLLPTINSPADLRKLSIDKLPVLAAELRDFMIDAVSKNGGHLAPSLGATDLTVALHYCFDTPADKLIWDVGHQAYAHKILTGRREQFATLRQHGGISGFPRRSESPYDALSAGHASTSVSVGLGMALARDLRHETHRVVVVIGDGALSGGLSFEGLNNIGTHATDITVVLNDNEMSISRNVGALSRYLTRVITDKRYNRLKTEIWNRLGHSNAGKSIRQIVQSVDAAVKHVVIPGKLFEDLGLRYFGPVDGHNIAQMIEVFRAIREAGPGPKLVHVLTKKGKGYSFAEDDATAYHGVASFSRSTGTPVKSSADQPTFSEVFGTTLVDIGRGRQDVVAITAAMPDGTKLSHFREAFPGRFFDVGIAESHAVTFAAGLAIAGLTPVVALYSTFLQRAYDQIIHDVALDGLHVVFAIDRAGLVGDDGPTHHGMFDLSFLRSVPGATIMAPADVAELRHMLYTAIVHLKGPVFIRYPRGSGPAVGGLDEPLRAIEPPAPRVLREGREVAVVSIGHFAVPARELCDELARQGLSPTLVDARFVKPLDTGFYTKLCAKHSRIITLEPNTLAGGFGSAVLELVSQIAPRNGPAVLRLGYPDAFVSHGSVEQLRRDVGLDAASIVAQVKKFLG